MPEPRDLESGWSILVEEAAAREAWEDAGRSPETFELQERIPELAQKLASGIELDASDEATLQRLSQDPECKALLEETQALLADLEAPAPGSAPDLRVVTVESTQAKEEPVMLHHMPQPMPPAPSGHSTPVLVAVALCSAAAAVALFAVVAPREPAPPAPAAPVAAVVPPIIVPTEVPVACEDNGNEPEAPEATPEADDEAELEQLGMELEEHELKELELDSKIKRKMTRTQRGDNKAFAEQLLLEARKSQYKNPRKAYALARASYRLRRTQDTLYVMTFSACRMGDAERAKESLAKLKKGRQTMVESCRKNGVDVE